MAGVWVAERTYHIVVAVCINRRGLAMPTFSPPPPPHVVLLALAIATVTAVLLLVMMRSVHRLFALDRRRFLAASSAGHAWQRQC